ncbi:unnamed protein product [Adineta ricciae]|uniref:Uncharacterized protein n=1 Tax=Adineta ricciae TaxID=249248 RepID=A0A815PEN6_ADIRI|nr:unnamed protein product [Adineta ricciae]CAF1448362.1 unnamed protein product [Adineta ricciae]
MLNYRDYLYTVEKTNDDKILFRRKNRDRKGRFKTNLDMDAILSEPTKHSHAPNIDQLPVVELKNKIKSTAADSEKVTSGILFSNLRSFPLDAAGQLPQTSSVLRMICCQRQAEATNSDNLIKKSTS